MTISRRKFLTSLTALVATPAVIRYSGVMAVNPVQASPYVIVHGLDLSGKMVLHKFWDPISANQFAGTPEFHNMVQVTSWDYGVPSKDMLPKSNHWQGMVGLDDRTVDQIIEDRILKQEQQRQAWLNDPAWTIYGIIGPELIGPASSKNIRATTQFNENGPIRKPWEMI